ATLTVTAAPVLTTITESPATASVEAGQTTAFTAAAVDQYGAAMTGITFTWASSDAAVATVSSAGVATGVAAGSATVTASASGQSGSATLTVTAIPLVLTTITVSPATASVQTGQTSLFTATGLDQNGGVMAGTTFTWTSSDSAVATVDSAGLATGVADGQATLTASSQGKSGTAVLTVTAAPPVVATVVVTPSTGTVAVGGTLAFTAEARDASGSVIAGAAIDWSSENLGVATVAATGVATGVAPGSSVISATSGGKSGAATLTVTSATPVVATVVVNPAAVSLAVGEAIQLTASAMDASSAQVGGVTFLWSSSGDNVATVAADGTVTAKVAGTAIITATTGGISGVSSVTVTAPKRVSGCGCAAGSEGMGGMLGFFALAGLAALRRPWRRRS
ncbi:MAG: Ig-like domain-containing protein, partial [Myxococcaceae bacterium]